MLSHPEGKHGIANASYHDAECAYLSSGFRPQSLKTQLRLEFLCTPRYLHDCVHVQP